MKLRLSSSRVLVKRFFFTLGQFLAWNPWRKTPNLHICYQNRMQMYVFQKSWYKHNINFQTKTRFFNKKISLFCHYNCRVIVQFRFRRGFQKTVFFEIQDGIFFTSFAKLEKDSFFETPWFLTFVFRENLKKLVVSWPKFGRKWAKEGLINAKGKKVTKKNCERLFKKMIVFFCKKTPQLLFSKAFSNLPLENKLQTKETEKVTGCLTK